MKEIGSEFWSAPVSEQQNLLFPGNTVWYLSGRTALYAVLQALGQEKTLRTAALPSWCCDSMIQPFAACGLDVSFYDVTAEDDSLVQHYEQIGEADVVLVLDYFGYSSSGRTVSCSGTVIRDLTHSVCNPRKQDAAFYFGSMRKWAAYATGGFAWRRDGSALPVPEQTDSAYVRMRRDAAAQKEQYMNGARQDKDFLSVFGAAEEQLDRLFEQNSAPAVFAADPPDIRNAQYADVQAISDARRRNAEFLLKALRGIPAVRPLFPAFLPGDVPLFVPVLVPAAQRAALRQALCSRNIYCPVHWPVSQYHRLHAGTAAIYETELSLICDQRYSEADMACIADVLHQFFA